MRKRLFAAAFLAASALTISVVWMIQGTVPQVAQTASESAIPDRSEQVLHQLTGHSDLIVSGRALDSHSTWIENGRVLVTLTRVAVDDVMKGNGSPIVTVMVPGGVDLNRRIPVGMTYPGAPSISPEEEVFLFLQNEDAVPGGYSVTGFSEGKYSIVNDEAGNPLVSRD